VISKNQGLRESTAKPPASQSFFKHAPDCEAAPEPNERWAPPEAKDIIMFGVVAREFSTSTPSEMCDNPPDSSCKEINGPLLIVKTRKQSDQT
jgi:hypothetical protein